jgi:hypothetical protein
MSEAVRIIEEKNQGSFSITCTRKQLRVLLILLSLAGHSRRISAKAGVHRNTVHNAAITLYVDLKRQAEREWPTEKWGL